METPTTRETERHKQNIESYELKWRYFYLERGFEAQWILINDGTPHGIYKDRKDAEVVKGIVQTEKPNSASTIIQIVCPGPPGTGQEHT